MSSPITDQPVLYNYTATAGQTVFAVNCRIFEGYLDAFTVTVNGEACNYLEVPLTNRQFKTIPSAFDIEGGEIVLGAGLAAGDAVQILRELPFERVAEFPEAGPVPMADVNREFSRLVALTQQLKSTVAEAPLLQLSLSGGAGLVGFTKGGTGAVLRTVQDKLRDTVSVKDFGAVGDGVTDDTAAIAAALASGAKAILLPAGTYKTTASLALGSGQRLRGEGKTNTTININSTVASAITLANGTDGARLEKLTLTRTGVATSTAHGIQCLGSSDRCELVDVTVTNHYYGAVLSTCDTGLLRRFRATKNLGYGIYQTNTSTYGASQWEFDDVLLDQNGIDGIRVESLASASVAGLILGSWNSVKTFANSGRGIHIVGNATTPIYDLRLVNAFVGSDQLGGIRIDSYGGKHRISGFFERAGRDATGPTLGTAAGNNAPGIEVSANNSDVVVHGVTIDENSLDGILHNGGLLTVSGAVIYNNGRALTGGRQNGILSNAGTLVVGGAKITNLNGGTSQLYGIATGHQNYHIVADLAGNATAPTALAGLGGTLITTTSLNIPGNLTATGSTHKLTKAASDVTLSLDGDSGRQKALQFTTGNLARWVVASEFTAEGGANVGSDFQLSRYSDAGGFLSTALTVTRATGDGTFNGNWNIASGKAYKINGVQVVGAQKPGWVAATGTATRATFATSTVTLSVLAEHVKALIDDLMGHGLLGA